jgi:hypothetical protein
MRGGGRLDLLTGAEVQEKVLFGKTAITFAYDLGLRRTLNENCREKNFTSDSPHFVGFGKFRFAKNGQENSVFGGLSLDIGIG